MAQATEPGFLAHRVGDSVAVAVRDLSAGPANGGYLHGDEPIEVTLSGQVPLGHKFALVDVEEGADVVEYGVRIGVATARIGRGDYVHVHNMRSARWQNSVA